MAGTKVCGLAFPDAEAATDGGGGAPAGRGATRPRFRRRQRRLVGERSVGLARLDDAAGAGAQLGDIETTKLRVECLRCFRVVEELRRDLVARWGADASWRDVGQRLLNECCEIRTGRHEEDGCWPDFR